jgi:hypothetical protein
MNPNLSRIVAIFRVVRNSDQLGPVAKNGMAGNEVAAFWRKPAALTLRAYRD